MSARSAAGAVFEKNARVRELVSTVRSVAGGVCKKDEHLVELAMTSRSVAGGVFKKDEHLVELAGTSRSVAGGVCKDDEHVVEGTSLSRNAAGGKCVEIKGLFARCKVVLCQSAHRSDFGDACSHEDRRLLLREQPHSLSAATAACEGAGASLMGERPWRSVAGKVQSNPMRCRREHVVLGLVIVATCAHRAMATEEDVAISHALDDMACTDLTMTHASNHYYFSGCGKRRTYDCDEGKCVEVTKRPTLVADPATAACVGVAVGFAACACLGAVGSKGAVAPMGVPGVPNCIQQQNGGSGIRFGGQ